ncbi:L-proline dehydrogenase [Amphritea atlantica]|uniref:Bifunctional protein PutA n=1 Tax=Amphritea atlantica TaxID=355243 RepID=A0A1H9D337_9GAMM|nr:proline dehydrogenase family protein [Amphritea atlantica]SEQ07253.1 L-proline dehydrogenase [Amphritea atlantica]
MFPLTLYFTDQQVKWNAAQLWNNIPAYYCADEATMESQLTELTAQLQLPPLRALVTDDIQQGALCCPIELKDADKLTGDEQIALTSLAERLLYLPDQNSITRFIEEKLTPANGQPFFERNSTAIQQTHTWKQAIRQQRITVSIQAHNIFSQLAERFDYPFIRTTLSDTVTRLRQRIIFSDSIPQISEIPENYAYSLHLLTEGVVTAEAARIALNRYLDAIKAISAQKPHCRATPSLSVKLSALTPRFALLKAPAVIEEVTQRLLHLLILARTENITITLEAEESCHVDLTLKVFENLLRSDLCCGWGGLGVTVQAYSKRALPILGWLNFLAQELQTDIPVRLVKGGYLDTEITRARQQGLADYPVYTRTEITDLSYLICAAYLLQDQCPRLTPQFASHNSNTLGQIVTLAEQSTKPIELQQQPGLGETLLTQRQNANSAVTQRVCIIIGSQAQLPPHLYRLLHNNLSVAPTSLSVNESAEADVSAEISAAAVMIDTQSQRQQLLKKVDAFRDQQWLAAPLINGEPVRSQPPEARFSPFNLSWQTGELFPSTPDDVREAYAVTRAGFTGWNRVSLSERVTIIRHFADLLEQHREELIALCIRETGKPLRDAIDELREAVELCRLYAAQALSRLSPQQLPPIAGEKQTLRYHGRGIFVCISPWSFPLAIGTGQVVAALLAGNSVIAKPANSTPLIAYRATQLLLDAGVARDAIALLPGSSESINESLLKDFRLSGISFTGSNQSAASITRLLAQREQPQPVPLITETSGLTVMIADYTALPEQIVRDAIEAAYSGTGQRGSALRVLYLPEETAEQLESMLTGAIMTLKTGNPDEPDTDLGPVIDNHALQALHGHIEHSRIHGRLIYEGELDTQHDSGYFVAPTLIRLHSIDELSEEHFGPILHIIRYQSDNLTRILEEINRTSYGLSLNILSQDNQTIDQICNLMRPASITIRRNQSTAHTHGQRFASRGLSGTGPKAGSPDYLLGFTQQTICSSDSDDNVYRV